MHTLLRDKLFDRLDYSVHPIVLGVGKKVFDEGSVPTNVILLECLARPKAPFTCATDWPMAHPETGDMSAPDRGAARDD